LAPAAAGLRDACRVFGGGRRVSGLSARHLSDQPLRDRRRDADERDFDQPIVSVSLGLPTAFLIGGAERRDRAQPLPVQSGDVMVFGGPARLLFHGVRPVKAGCDPLLGPFRYNLTFRCAR
jgi:hypothetical protein